MGFLRPQGTTLRARRALVSAALALACCAAAKALGGLSFGGPSELVLSSGSYTAAERGAAVVHVRRTGGTTGTATVVYATANLTAVSGIDYTASSGTLTFNADDTFKTIRVQILSDGAVEAHEAFSVSLASPSGATLGSPSVATVTLVDDEAPALVGQWSGLAPWPTLPIHMHLLPTGSVMFWDRHDDAQGWDGHPRLWEPTTGEFRNDVPDVGYDLFCAGHAFLADGRLLVAGGHIRDEEGEDKASIYDPFANSWKRLAPMNRGRWYPTTTTLADGNVVVLAGTYQPKLVNPVPQIWEARDEVWRDLTGAAIGAFPDWAQFYPFLFLAPNGKLFSAGPQQMGRYLDTTGTGAWTDVSASSLAYRDYGSSVMYDDGRVLIVGGNPRDTNGTTPSIFPSAKAEVIDLNDASPAWREISPMSTGRRQLAATLLPDGTVLVTGGSSAPGFNAASGAVLHAELWDPTSETWTPLAGAARYRGYHSGALLLPDGRVLVAGGGHPDPDDGSEERNAEIYSPPYLFRGARPQIGAAPQTVTYGRTFAIETPQAASIVKVNWIRLSSVTHAFNQGQRINHLGFSQTAGQLHVSAPPSRALAPPGHYLLFIVNRLGVPSSAHTLRLRGLADADGTTRVDGLDLARLGRAFGAQCGDARFDPAVDFDRAYCTIDGDDLAILAADFGQSDTSFMDRPSTESVGR